MTMRSRKPSVISKWVYFGPSREAGVTAAPVPSKHVVGVRIPCLALTTNFRLPPHKGAIAVAVRAHDIALCDLVEDSAIGRTSRHVRYESAFRSRVPMVE